MPAFDSQDYHMYQKIQNKTCIMHASIVVTSSVIIIRYVEEWFRCSTAIVKTSHYVEQNIIKSSSGEYNKTEARD